MEDRGFIKRLKASGPAVFAVARWFWERDYYVQIPPRRYAPTSADWRDYVDSGDLIVTRPLDGAQIIEVKGTSPVFSGRLDYPFDPFIVSNVGTVDRAKDEVSAYFIVSADLKAALILPTSTKSQWFKEWVDASNTGRQEEFYMAYKSSAKFISLEV